MIRKFGSITLVRLGKIDYIYYNNELVAIKDPSHKCYYVDQKFKKKTSIVKFIKDSYDTKYDGYIIQDCFDANNIIESVQKDNMKENNNHAKA